LKNKEIKLKLFMLSKKRNYKKSKQELKSPLLKNIKLNKVIKNLNKPSKLFKFK